jgi:hypothetical protein
MKYTQAYLYNQQKAVNYVPPRDPKDDREVSLGTVHEKVVSFIARLPSSRHASSMTSTHKLGWPTRQAAATSGDFWSASTIHGNRARGSGLLSNALYDGRLVWNKVTLRKDPRTGKRVSRVNPELEWQTTSVPHLRIVEAETFAAAQIRMKERSHLKTPAARRKPRHLLSGLLRCGCCGGALVAKDRDA